MSISAYPLQWPSEWPRAKYRKAARFDTPWQKTVARLTLEVERLHGSGLIISSNVPLRRDGLPYADQAQDRIADPGVAVYFTIRGKPRVMAHDLYETVHHNLHSIAVTIDAMRAIERHGGALMLERAFEGFSALPAPGSIPWWQILQINQAATKADVEAAFRKLARERHPDHGGSDAMMADLNAARAAGLKECRA